MSGHHHRATNPDIEADVPDEVANFLRELNEAVVNKDLSASHHLYEQVYPQLTQQFFTNKAARNQSLPFRSWPNLRFVKECFTSDVTQLLYQMLVARHLFTDRAVSASVRCKSWETFTELFDQLMDPKVDIDLPNGWLWDILDEFIYQLQTHHNKRLKLDASFPAAAWSLPVVAARLEDIVDRSGIRDVLKSIRDGAAEPSSVLGSTGPQHVHRALGLFSIITQMRLSVAVGDYVGGLAALEPLCLFTLGRQLTQLAAPAHVALFYNVGFSFMMLRRYTDAAATLKHALLVKSANRPYVDALQAQVVSLLTLSSALGNLPTEDFSAFLTERARQNQEDDAHMLGHGDLERFRDVFAKACPKFISLADLGGTSYTEFTGQEGKELQLRVFMRAVQQRVEALKLRGFLKVYSTIEAQKITTLLGTSTAASSRFSAQAHLVCLKGKSVEKVHDDAQADLLSGEFKPTAIIDFTADADRVTVVQRKERVSTAQRFLQLLQNI